MNFDVAQHIAFDFESSGVKPEYALQPWRIPYGETWATSLAIVQRFSDGRAPITMGGLNPTVDDMRAFLQYAIDNKLRIVGWNTVFDITVLMGYGLTDLVMRCKWLDGMLLWRHAFIEPEYEATSFTQRKSYSLKPCVAELWPQFASYAEDVDFHDESPAARAKLHKYNVRDTTFTLMAAEHWWNRLTNDQQRAAIIEAESLPLVAQSNFEGMVIDTIASADLRQHLSMTAHDKLTLLLPLGVTEAIVRSPLKLAELLFDQWKLPVLKENTGKKTGKVSRATDKEVLHELSLTDPRAKVLREYREALNNRTKFAEGLRKSAEYNVDFRAHPNAIVFGTYSGRLTYSSSQKIKVANKAGTGLKDGQAPTGFALHQMKNASEFRSQVLAPPGYDIVEFDAAGQEFRWMAIASGDPVMMQLCLPGEDPHSFMGAAIAKRDYHDLMKSRKNADAVIAAHADLQRKLGKVGNLSLQYRTSAKKLRVVARLPPNNIPMELPEAQMIHVTYQRTYKQVPIYWGKQIAQTQRRGYVETFAGRRVIVTGDWTGSFGWSMGSTSINYRIQGTGADQKYLALAVLKSLLSKYGAMFAWDLHDGLYFYVPSQHTMAFAREGKARLDALPYRQAWGFDPPIPLPWDCKKGGSWGTLKEVQF